MRLQGQSSTFRTLVAVSAIAVVIAACGGAADTDEQSVAAPPPQQPEEPGVEPGFYEGTRATIEAIVPFSPGGGTDVMARTITPIMAQYLGDRITFQVENIPGAGSILGANQYLTRPKDGFHVLMTSASTTMPFIFGVEEALYDYSDFVPIIGWPAGAIQYVRADTGIKTGADLLAYDGVLNYAGVSPTGGELPRLLAFHLLGVPFAPIFGYGGRGAIQAAFEQGEADLDSQTTEAFLAGTARLVESGDAVAVSTHGFLRDGKIVRDPAFPDLPTLPELYEETTGRPAAGPGWSAYATLILALNNLQGVMWIHKDAPPEAIQALQSAALKALPELEEAVNLPYTLLVGDELQGFVDGLANVSPEVIDYLVGFVGEIYGEDLS